MASTPHDWTVFVFETISGNVVAEIPWTGSLTYSRKLNDPGSGTVTVAIGGQGISQGDIQQLAMPWRWSLAICYRSAIIQAGPITGETYSASGGGTTSLAFANIWKVFTKRILLPPTSTWTSGSITANDANTILSGLTWGGVAQTIVQNQVTRGGLPITFVGSPATGGQSVTYAGYDLNLVSDVLTNLTQEQGGCEIDFAPYWYTAGQNIKFQMRVSDTRIGQIGAPWVWDFGGRGALQDADYSSDGSLITCSEYVRGSGSQTTLVAGAATSTALTAAGYPLLESVNGDHTSISDVPTLNSYAQADVATYQSPIITPSVYVRVDGTGTSGAPTGSPTLEQINVGDTGTFVFQGHRRIPDGEYTMRITEITAGTDVGSVKLGLQPTQNAF